MIKKIIFTMVRLFFGLFLYAFGLVLAINSNIGLSPWDVFGQGISKTLNITMGHATISVGFVIILINFILGERIGWGTIFNMIFIGEFMDILMLNRLIPISTNFVVSVIMMFCGVMVIALATFLYIGAELGAGPRDGLMVALTRKTNKSVRVVRSIIEIGALVVGYLLGGFVGIGTLIMAFSVGHAVQFIFKLFKFDVSKVKHRYIVDDILFVKNNLY
ncbi:YczE/YyaS/YitT family protein [Clostridium fungisolvens]|uniref:Membrane protein YczE n=1 Tax=Clostridium fungisolvens TaxID=1604897 RepID=A0A6V8SLK1_9CLOT|nr:hypothetical protein [Clostridium fungisolvens]GFP78119.1 hypothetical protein bsdtw1_04313 [Clostridium fungisolvens]